MGTPLASYRATAYSPGNGFTTLNDAGKNDLQGIYGEHVNSQQSAMRLINRRVEGAMAGLTGNSIALANSTDYLKGLHRELVGGNDDHADVVNFGAKNLGQASGSQLASLSKKELIALKTTYDTTLEKVNKAKTAMYTGQIGSTAALTFTDKCRVCLEGIKNSICSIFSSKSHFMKPPSTSKPSLTGIQFHHCVSGGQNHRLQAYFHLDNIGKVYARRVQELDKLIQSDGYLDNFHIPYSSGSATDRPSVQQSFDSQSHPVSDSRSDQDPIAPALDTMNVRNKRNMLRHLDNLKSEVLELKKMSLGQAESKMWDSLIEIIEDVDDLGFPVHFENVGERDEKLQAVTNIEDRFDAYKVQGLKVLREGAFASKYKKIIAALEKKVFDKLEEIVNATPVRS